MGMLWQDAKYGLRTLTRSLGYTAVMLLTLAYSESNRLVSVQESISAVADKYPMLPVSARHFIEWRARCASFENLALIDNSFKTLTGRGDPERLETLQVSPNLFETLRVQPVLGRTFVAQEEEEDAARVAVISDGVR
jgi:putative ABC transport system permease protein